jgi:hypothetical protein
MPGEIAMEVWAGDWPAAGTFFLWVVGFEAGVKTYQEEIEV